jgi:hypothetical protein
VTAKMAASDLTFVNNQPKRSTGVDVSSTDLKNSWERFCSVNDSTWMTVSLNSTDVEMEGDKLSLLNGFFYLDDLITMMKIIIVLVESYLFITCAITIISF